MRFSESFLEEIKARLAVSEVVGRRVKLTRAGREFKGLSPFKAEKTPSFTVNDQKGFYHDFSSGKHGGIFDFVMETEGLSFPEAVERLAAEAGLACRSRTPQAAEREKGARRCIRCSSSPPTSSCRSRGARWRQSARLSRRSRDRAGAATRVPARLCARRKNTRLRDHLAPRASMREPMIEAGLLMHGEDIAVPYDRFRDRVMFPIADRGGQVVAFGGRALETRRRRNI